MDNWGQENRFSTVVPRNRFKQRYPPIFIGICSYFNALKTILFRKINNMVNYKNPFVKQRIY